MWQHIALQLRMLEQQPLYSSEPPIWLMMSSGRMDGIADSRLEPVESERSVYELVTLLRALMTGFFLPYRSLVVLFVRKLVHWTPKSVPGITNNSSSIANMPIEAMMKMVLLVWMLAGNNW